MKFRKTKRIGAFLLTLSLLASQTGANVYGDATDVSYKNTGGICEHHLIHTEDCGYLEGHACVHEHDDSCYIQIPNCIYETGADLATPAVGVEENHICTTESGCVKQILDCHHIHDDACLYQEAQACRYVCQICLELEKESGTGNEAAGEAPVLPECICENACTETTVNPDCPACAKDYLACARGMTGDTAAAREVSTLIDALPAVDSIYENMVGDSDPAFEQWKAEMDETIKKIEEARSRYDGLSEVEKAFVGDARVGKLAELENLAARMKEKSELGVGDEFTDQKLKFRITGVAPNEVEVAGHVDGEEAAGQLNIPERVTWNNTEYLVTGIGDQAFNRCAKLTGTLMIPSSITRIGTSAFYNCSGLTGDLNIADSVTNIGANAFAKCTGFDGQLKLSKNLTKIDSQAFYECKNLTGDLIIPDCVTEIGANAFMRGGYNGQFKLPDNLVKIGEFAFFSCGNLTGELRIPGHVTEIGKHAFEYTGFSSIIVPESVTYYGYQICSANPKLEYATIAAKAAKVGDSTFNGDSSLKSAKILYAEELGYAVFHQCSALRKLYLPAKPPAINFDDPRDFDALFEGCPTWRTLYFIDSNGDKLSKEEWAVAKANYQAVNDGNITDDLWYGWRLIDYACAVTVEGNSYVDFYEEGETVTISAGTKEGYTFTGWTGPSEVIFADATKSDTTFPMPAQDVTVTATWDRIETPPVTTYHVTILDGGTGSQGSGDYSENDTVSISAGSKDGYVFKRWVSTDGVAFDNEWSAAASFTMPARDVTIQATWGSIDVPPAPRYQVTISDGAVGSQGSGSYEEGETVRIQAGTKDGWIFTNWTGPSGVVFENVQSADTTFIMPGYEVTITANWRKEESGGSGDNGSGGSGDNSTGDSENNNSGSSGDNGSGGSGNNSSGGSGSNGPRPNTSGQTDAGSSDSNSVGPGFEGIDSSGTGAQDGTQAGGSTYNPVDGTVKAPTQIGQNGGTNVTITESVIEDAINNRNNDQNGSYGSTSGGSVNVKIDNTDAGSDDLTVILPKDTMESIINQKVDEIALKVNKPDITIKIDRDAVQDLYQQARDGVKLQFTPVSASTLPGGAAQASGGRPMYQLTAVSQGNGGSITNLYQGKLYVEIPYIMREGEHAGYLYGVVVDQAGHVTWLDKSSYDIKRQSLILMVDQFAACGIGYQEKGCYADITGHWAEPDLEFAAARGLLLEKAPGMFGPDDPLTRGDLVMALGRMEGINPADYPASGQFEDVPADSIYAPYIRWAIANGIITTPELNAFYPNEGLTRQELAGAIHIFTVKTGRTLPSGIQTVTCKDSDQVAEGIRSAVQTLWSAGIMLETSGGNFAPKAQVTRGSGAAILHRYVETEIKPDAVQGFRQNDQGQWQYYQNGRPVTGWNLIKGQWYYFDNTGIMKAGVWCEIDGKWYYFYLDGRMVANTFIDGFAIGGDGAMIE